MSGVAERAFAVRRQRGVALLMVLGLLALLGSVVADFQFTSRVDLQLAYNARDELQAEYNALSALRFRALILKQSRKVQTFVNAMAQAMGGGSAAPPISQIMEMLPVECGLMSAITKKVDKTLDGDDAGEDFFPGECFATSENEHSKIAINLLANPTQGRAQAVASMLVGLLSDVRLLKHFEEDDRNGQHAESPLILVNAITDWIDPDHTEQGTLGDEDRRYQYLKDPYRAKNAPFDSIAELQLVYGIDDSLYNMLKNHITVYNAEAALELSTAPIDRILLALMGCMKPGTPPETFLAAAQVVQQTLGMARAAFLPVTVGLLQTALTSSGVMGYIDPTLLGQTFKDGNSVTWHTIIAEGRMGKATRKIRAVFQASEGNFYYVRVE